MSTSTMIGKRLELFVDDALIQALAGQASLRLHRPVPREVALVCNQPWEGNMCGFVTVFPEVAGYRMYYKGWAVDLAKSSGEAVVEPHGAHICLAESADGVHWRRRFSGHCPFPGSRGNNIVWQGETELRKGLHGFSPFLDANPACSPQACYKAVGAAWDSTKGLFALQSPDGIHWSLVQEAPIISGCAFDSQNLAFWDSARGEYRAYMRDVSGNWFRRIRTATSRDFITWSPPEWLEYPGAPEEQLYTNQVQPYYRAPHLLLGFPTRYVERQWSPTIDALPELEHRRLRAKVCPRFGAALTDGLFMASRDGRVFKRWDEAFLRPGLRLTGSWAYGDCYQAWGLLETPAASPGCPPELSLYAPENYWREPATVIRRHSLRVDGFVSLHAPLGGGELLTRPVVFSGSRLQLNVATSAAGSARVEVQDVDGAPLPGFAVADCHEIVGDTLAYTVQWRDGADFAALAGRPVRLRFSLHDADLYAYQFS